MLSEDLQQVGTGISRIDVEEIALDNTGVSPHAIREFVRKNIPQGTSRSIILNDGIKVIVEKDGNITPPLRLNTYRKGSKGEEVPFNLESESDGTQRFMNLHPMLSMLKDGSTVFVIDEIERSLHSQLTRYFIELALGDATPPPHSQLLFTTHDTNLIDTDLLRTDEIWFVEKDKGGASHLSALVEFKYPEGIDIEQGYLIGRFGALPFLGNLRKLKNVAAQREN